MRYISTRGAWADTPQPFSSILLEGLAPDGGLAVPQAYPRFGDAQLAALRPLAYPDLALAVLSPFIDDIAPADLAAIVRRTYTRDVFGSDDITPLVTLEPGLHLLAVSNGPTLAFKDIALQLLGNLFEHVLEREGRGINIVGATSGDTGSSAEYAMRGKHGVTVFMLSPRGRMSSVPDGADVLACRAQHLQPRRRRHVRRLPGHGEGGQRRRGVQGAPPHRRGELDQLGAHRRADRLLLQGLFRGQRPQRRHRSTSRFPPATSATSSPAMSRGRWACRSGG